VNELHNGLIAQLAPSDQAWLLKKAQIVHFEAGDILGTPATSSPQVFFLISGAVALFVSKNAKDSHTGLAVGLIGAEGALGLQAALSLGAGNLTLLVQSPGSAYVLDGLTLQQLIRRKSDLLLIFSRYLWSVYQTVCELAATSQTEDIRMRFANWLLLSAERCAPHPLVITHAHIAQMLGVRRASITLVAREMKLAGIIGYSRGAVEIKKMEVLIRLAHT
jgi:CRP-like cAMP-binding protein